MEKKLKKRVKILDQLNFISPYIELPKRLTVKQNLEVYGRLYDIKNIKKIAINKKLN